MKKKPSKSHISRAAITIDLHGIIDDIVAKLAERGMVDLEAEKVRAKVPPLLVIARRPHDAR